MRNLAHHRSLGVALALLLSACTITLKPRRPVEAIGLRLTAVDVSSSHACGITREGEAFCWGTNSNGELGNGSTEFVSGVVRVVGGQRFASISTSFTRTCALTTNGEAYCWGTNPTGAPTRSLKALEESSRGAPVRIAERLELAQIGVGQWHACGLTRDGDAYCWGRADLGSLGSVTEASTTTPVKVAGGHTFSTLSVGEDHTCAITTTGEAFCWGAGGDGRLGHGHGESSVIPVQVAGELRFRSISAGERHTCAIALDGAAYCWGWNGDKQLGAATTEDCGGYPCSTTPLKVDRFHFTAISAGKARTCALANDGEVVCWGDTRPRPQRMADTSDSAIPTPVLSGQRFSTISVASIKACGLASDGDAYCWNTLAGLPVEPLRMPMPRFVTYAIVGAILGGLLGYVSYRTAPDRYGVGAVVSGAGTGAFIGFFIGAGIGFKAFLDALPW
jgi:alpha-tubulin suppressor-like RCC1 family protein